MPQGQHGQWMGEVSHCINFWTLTHLLKDAADTMQPELIDDYKIRLIEDALEIMKIRRRVHADRQGHVSA